MEKYAQIIFGHTDLLSQLAYFTLITVCVVCSLFKMNGWKIPDMNRMTRSLHSYEKQRRRNWQAPASRNQRSKIETATKQAEVEK
ncbi:60S ribosomal export protein [Trichinella spiralis]|uniref:60S ribosomal export protein n=1 Tax=Trichinella spiralis TaxID=6334 RepID=A0ABR3KN87_TRISP